MIFSCGEAAMRQSVLIFWCWCEYWTLQSASGWLISAMEAGWKIVDWWCISKEDMWSCVWLASILRLSLIGCFWLCCCGSEWARSFESACSWSAQLLYSKRGCNLDELWRLMRFAVLAWWRTPFHHVCVWNCCALYWWLNVIVHDCQTAFKEVFASIASFFAKVIGISPIGPPQCSDTPFSYCFYS